MANSELYNKTYKIPSEVLKRINSVLVSNPHGEGVKRAKNILKNGYLTYQGMKGLKHFFDYYNPETDKLQYELAGGDLMKSFVERTLNQDRDGVERSDRIKRDLSVDVNLGTKASQMPRLNEAVLNEALLNEAVLYDFKKTSDFNTYTKYRFTNEENENHFVQFANLGVYYKPSGWGGRFMKNKHIGIYQIDWGVDGPGRPDPFAATNKDRLPYSEFKTVIEIVKSFIQEKNPKELWFYANDPQKQKIYIMMANRSKSPGDEVVIEKDFKGKEVVKVKLKTNLNESVGKNKIKKNATAVVVGKDSRFLLLKRSSYPDQWMPNKWSLIGGTVEKGENPETACKREIFEECGLEIKDMVDTFTIKRDDVMEYVFACRYDGEPIDIELNEEHDGYGWFTYPEIEYLDVVPHLKEYLTMVFKKYD